MKAGRWKQGLVWGACAAAVAGVVIAQSSPPMSFFVTSVGSGKGADFGGLAGADKHCQTLAAAAGAASDARAASAQLLLDFGLLRKVFAPRPHDPGAADNSMGCRDIK